MLQNRKSIVILLGLLCFSSIWLALLFQIRISADVAWLTQAAEHFLRGESMVEYYFETNPPMSILIYLPVALLKSLGLASWTAVNLFTLIMSFISVGISAYFLKFWTIPKETKALFVFGFVLVITFLSSFDYGQRDHLIAMMLLPFILGQLSITFGHPVSKPFRFFVFVLAAPFILIKPHYGLIPAALMCHRAWEKRSLRVIVNSDVIVLAAMTLAYAAIVVTVFPGFISTILPASLDLYTQEFSNVSTLVKFMISLGFAVLAFLFAKRINSGEATRTFLLIFAVLAALTLVPYLIQYKGFRYHLLPFLSLIVPVTLCSIYALLPSFKNSERLKKVFMFDMVFLLIAGTVFAYKGSLTMNHNALRDDVIAQIIAATPEGSSFYIEYNTTDYTIHISEYMNREFASRFPAPWLFPNDYEDKQTWDKYLELNKQYIFEDFERYEPELIFLVNNERYLSILTAYKDTPEFKDFFSRYQYAGDFIDQQHSNMINNFGDTDQIQFAMYVLKK